MSRNRKPRRRRLSKITAELNGVSVKTILTIATRDDIVITHAGPTTVDGVKGYLGWITLGEADRFRGLLNANKTLPTIKEAEDRMRRVVKAAKEYLAHPRAIAKMPPFIRQVMGLEAPGNESRIVRSIIDAARS